MNKCKWYELHKWKDIHEEIYNEYLSETYKSYTSSLKICTKCGTIKEYQYDSQGGWWCNLNEEETKIVKSKIEDVNGKLILGKNMIKCKDEDTCKTKLLKILEHMEDNLKEMKEINKKYDFIGRTDFNLSDIEIDIVNLIEVIEDK